MSDVLLTNGPTNMSGLTGGLESNVSNQTLTIKQALPVVNVTAPAAISSTNMASYSVSGTCSASAGTVTVTVGASATGTSACASGNFTVSGINVSGVADGTTVSVKAAQTNITGTGSNTKNAVKETIVSLNKAFGAASIAHAGSTSLTFTISASASKLAQIGFTFTDTLDNLTVVVGSATYDSPRVGHHSATASFFFFFLKLPVSKRWRTRCSWRAL